MSVKTVVIPVQNPTRQAGTVSPNGWDIHLISDTVNFPTSQYQSSNPPYGFDYHVDAAQGEKLEAFKYNPQVINNVLEIEVVFGNDSSSGNRSSFKGNAQFDSITSNHEIYFLRFLRIDSSGNIDKKKVVSTDPENHPFVLPEL